MNYSEDGLKDYHRRYFFVTAIVIFLISVSIFSYYEFNQRSSDIEDLRQSEIQVVNITDITLTNDLKLVTSDLQYLHNAFKESLINNKDYDSIASNWLEFSKQRKLYDQIRYISFDGDEQIRINKNPDASYTIVAKEDLQNKADRYYFSSSLLLDDGEIYLSPLDLNVENGVVEIPYKPMLRLLMPVFDGENISGVIVLNYLAGDLLNSLRTISKGSVGNVSLLNSDGYYLSSENSSKEWGFMFDKVNETYKVDFPDAWERMVKGEEEILNSSGYFFSHQVNISSIFETGIDAKINGDDHYWVVVSIIPRDSANDYYFYDNSFDLLLDIITKNYLMYILLFILSVVIGFFVFLNNRYHTRIKNFSRYDSLTSIYNRGYGMNLIGKLFNPDNRKGFPVSLCYLDINGLKQVNDNLGHHKGSELIISVASVIRKTIGKDDYVIRLGGDELIIVFKSKTRDEAELVWSDIIKQYREINESEKRPYIISVSHGIAQFERESDINTDEAINIVDELMYEEKQRIKKDLKSVLR